jgi:Major Facilitator Superfamily
MKVSEVAWVYMLTVFSIVYATSKLGLSRSVILNGIVAAALLEVLTIPLFGALSDRIGRKPMYIAGALLSAAIAFPIFWMLDTRDPFLILIAIAVAMTITHGAMFGPQAAYAGTVRDSCALQRRLTRLPDLGRDLRRLFSDHCRGALRLGWRDLASIALSRRVGIDYVDGSVCVPRNIQGRHFADLNPHPCPPLPPCPGPRLRDQRGIVDIRDRLPCWVLCRFDDCHMAGHLGRQIVFVSDQQGMACEIISAPRAVPC